MLRPLRVCVVLGVVSTALAVTGGTSSADGVTGRLKLPEPPARPPLAAKGFLDRIENPIKRVQPVNVTAHMLVVLDGAAPSSPGQVTWELVGESFARPVVGVPLGAELVIKNVSRMARTLAALEDPKLLPEGPINPTGNKSFRAAEEKIYTIADKDAPHLRGTIVVVNARYIATVDATGKFELPDVPEGAYKVRVFYKDGWLALEEPLNVPKKGKAEVTVTVPTGFPLKK